MVPGSTSTSRAQVEWSVQFHTSDGFGHGMLVNINQRGAFIRCKKPIRLSESFQLTIEPPENEPINITAEVVFSNVYGPDDHTTPRGMGVLFLDVSDEDRQIISRAIRQHLETNKDKIDPNKLRTLKTLMIDEKQIASEAA